jgi:hypothetical protein
MVCWKERRVLSCSPAIEALSWHEWIWFKFFRASVNFRRVDGKSPNRENTISPRKFMSLRAHTKDEKPEFVMPAWIAGIQIRKDASGDIRVDLDSSPPCWNDGIDGLCLTRAKPI